MSTPVCTKVVRCQGWEGPCDRTDAVRQRMNTQYVDDERNFATLCPDCWNLCHEYWAEMWADYWSTCR